MSKVSLVVPCCNREKFISATVKSVMLQDTPDWELILVDDGSKDNSWEIICNLSQIDHRIKGFRKCNGGVSSARNYGFSKTTASAHYVMFLDSDDQLEPYALTRLSRYLDTHLDVGLVGCQLQDISADGRSFGARKRSRWAPGLIFPRELRDDEVETPFATFFCATGQGPFAMFRRSVYLQTEGWDESFWPHEDTDMFCQMALLAKVHFLPERLYLYRHHAAQVMKDGARVQRNYAVFRAKWDHRSPRSTHEACLLRDAKKYYYTMHKPCRELKVARKALLEFFESPSLGRLRWFIGLCISALNGFIVKRFASHYSARVDNL